MSDSQILSIYDTIAGWTITVSSKTPTVLDVDALPNTADTARLPTRLLMPLGTFAGAGGARDSRFVTLNSITNTTWTIRDLCLWQAVGQGIGYKTIVPVLVEYAGKYLDAVRASRQMTHTAYIQRVDVQPTVVEWPEQSGRFFYAIDATLEVAELNS
jgi:hypothetical protein